MAGAQGFGITDRICRKSRKPLILPIPFALEKHDMKITDAVQSVPADAENAQWPEAHCGGK